MGFPARAFLVPKLAAGSRNLPLHRKHVSRTEGGILSPGVRFELSYASRCERGFLRAVKLAELLPAHPCRCYTSGVSCKRNSPVIFRPVCHAKRCPHSSKGANIFTLARGTCQSMRFVLQLRVPSRVVNSRRYGEQVDGCAYTIHGGGRGMRVVRVASSLPREQLPARDVCAPPKERILLRNYVLRIQ